jgi:anti-sigma factor RsiW
VNCRDFDELAARCLEGDATAEERLIVKEHAASCARCRESLATFEELERSLTGLKETIPPWRLAEARLVRSMSAGDEHPLLKLIWNPPVVCGLLFVVLGAVLLMQARPLASGTELLGSEMINAMNGLGVGLGRLLATMQRIDLATLVALAVFVTLAPLASFGFAVQRFGRR